MGPYYQRRWRRLLTDRGYHIEHIGTAIIKPVSSDLISNWWDDMLDALDQLVASIPDYGWYIYALGR